MSQSLLIFLNEIFFVGLCILAAYIEKNFFKYNHSFKHWWGISIYSLVVLIQFLLWRNLALDAASFLIGWVVFSPFLNKIRKDGFWYTNKVDPNGSELDKLWSDVIQKVLYFGALAGLIVLNIIFFK